MKGLASSLKTESRAASESRGLKPVSESIVCGLTAAIETIAIVAASALAYSIWLVRAPGVVWTDYIFVTLFGALVAANLFHVAHAYRFEVLTHSGESLKRMTAAWSSVALALVAISFFTKSSEDYSRTWSVLWFASAWTALAVIRVTLYLKCQTWIREGRLTRSVAIVGDGAVVHRLLDHLRSRSESGVRVVGVFNDTAEHGGNGKRPPARDLGALVQLVRRQPVDTIIIALPPTEEVRVLNVIDRLKFLPVDIRLCPGPVSFHLERAGVSHLAHLPLLNVLDKPLTDWQSVAKKIEDRLLSVLILLAIAPVFPAIAALIKLDSPGPVLFRQKRYGFNNQLIDVYKFRTMHHAARDEKAEQLTLRNDPRVTRVGALLRKFSLDELPQFLNVLRGEMSIVGPRPHAISAKAAGTLYDEAVRDYAARHRVKPGITGWAQVNGWRGETETLEQIRQRVEHDLAYIDNWSLRLDIKIIFRTVIGGFTGKNAF
ncbi:undecaprenyl-phosphate glucose phosphotransferase [Parvibaculum sp.]|uniref:undecaprenyl-phosphate glucose phosphotransferase n=1 Tax=Parvibaculum sp. TaxID=2024848 RepID=UPI0034A08701